MSNPYDYIPTLPAGTTSGAQLASSIAAALAQLEGMPTATAEEKAALQARATGLMSFLSGYSTKINMLATARLAA